MFKKVATFILGILVFLCVGNTSFALTARWLFNKKLAIVIDDMGYNKNLAYKFASLRLPLAFSFLPDAPFSSILSKQLGQDGFTIMIHMPSEPISYPYINPGKNAIYIKTPEKRVEYLLERAKRKIFFAVGLDNHEGSLILQDKKQMDVIMRFLKNNHMFFVDSMTTPKSIGYIEAEKFYVPYAVRDVFLDDYKNVAYIKKQLHYAIKLLKNQDSVVAIGHCNQETYLALKESLNAIEPYIIDIKYILKEP